MVAPEKPKPPSVPKSVQFAVGVRGYNQRQVDERIAELTKELKETAHNRDEAVATSADLTKALSYAQKELADTKAALARVSSSPSGAGAMAERVRMMMQLAEEEIADLRAAAEADAAATREEADKYSQETRRTSDRLAREAEDERKRLMAQAQEEIKKQDEAAAAKRDELDAVALRARQEADEKAAAEAKAKREEADRIAAEEITLKKQETDAALADAKQKQAEADKNRTLALDLRKKVAERLAATDAAVQEAIRLLAPTEDSGVAEEAAADGKPAPVAS
jgi:chromosome segregation ATPase